jgi:hypothetical protein
VYDPRVKTASQWKAFYSDERGRLGEAGLHELLDRAPELELPSAGALVFPHTILSVTGELTAAVARAVLRSGADEVLALGVLHGGRDEDAQLVGRARAGDVLSRLTLRRVHDGADPVCAEEFSLDAFEALLRAAAAREGRKAPRVLARYPFLVGDDPQSLNGIHELAKLAGRMPVVATADPLHHGAGYGDPVGRRRAEGDDSTRAWARACIEAQLDLLARGEWTAFARLAAEVRSDFRDAGPVLAHLLRSRGALRGEVLQLRLVDYAAALGAEAPSWVAGPLMRLAA